MRGTARRLAAVTAATAALLLGGCGQQEQGPPTSRVYATAAPAPTSAALGPGVPATAAGQDAGFSLQDVSFLQQMIPHHQQAILMATAALDRSPSPRVRELAETVRQVQLAEVQQMSDWLFSIGIAPNLEAGTGGHDHGGGMTQQDVVDLGSRPAGEFDARFADLMTQHSLGAIELSRREAQAGANAGATRLAAEIARRESEQVMTLAGMG